MEQLSIPYFRALLSKNISNLEKLCEDWNGEQENLSVPEEVRDDIRTTIGLTKLLLRQKLKQFGGLIDDSEFKRGEKEISCVDLQGFWDMVYFEVEKIQNSFEKLKKCKSNNWVFVQENTSKTDTKKKMFPAVAKSVVATKHHASAARQRLAEVKRKMKAQMSAQVAGEKPSVDLENNIPSKIESTPTRRERKRSKQNADEQNELKSAISNITNLTISEQITKVGSQKKQPAKISRAKTKECVDKENVAVPLSLDSDIKASKKKGKEIMPLQCVTRLAAKRALLTK